jgi:hypothetical protein
MAQFVYGVDRRLVPDRRVRDTATYPVQDSDGVTISRDRRHRVGRRVSVIKPGYVAPCIRAIGDTATSPTAQGFRALPKEIEQGLLMLMSLYKEQEEERAMDLWEKLKEKIQGRYKKSEL